MHPVLFCPLYRPSMLRVLGTGLLALEVRCTCIWNVRSLLEILVKCISMFLREASRVGRYKAIRSGLPWASLAQAAAWVAVIPPALDHLVGPASHCSLLECNSAVTDRSTTKSRTRIKSIAFWQLAQLWHLSIIFFSSNRVLAIALLEKYSALLQDMFAINPSRPGAANTQDLMASKPLIPTMAMAEIFEMETNSTASS